MLRGAKIVNKNFVNKLAFPIKVGQNQLKSVKIGQRSKIGEKGRAFRFTTKVRGIYTSVSHHFGPFLGRGGGRKTELCGQDLYLRSCPPCTGVLRGPSRKVPHGVLFECFGHLPRSAPKSVFWALFGTCRAKKKAKKHSKSTLWGTPRQVPKGTQKALFGAHSGSGSWALLYMAGGIANLYGHLGLSDHHFWRCLDYLTRQL